MTHELNNQFAVALVSQVVKRALGMDPGSRRIVNTRPSDHVLAGFLTPPKPPVSPEPIASELGMGEIQEDLPQDSPYEQSAIGLEWLVPREGLAGHQIVLTVDFSLFVRCLPSYMEQEHHLTWNKTKVNQEYQTSTLIPVWERVDIPSLQGELDLAHLFQSKTVTVSLALQLAAAWAQQASTITQVFPATGDISIRREDFSPEQYAAFVAKKKPPTAQPLLYNWTPVVDARLVAVPTEPACQRLSLRLLNRTPWRDSIAQDFFDPNLYAVRLSVYIPKPAHRAMEFTDLPRSYRYDRTIAAVGINADVFLQEETASSLRLATNSIPSKRMDRLEPRDTIHVDPTFDALLQDPLPLLRRLQEQMLIYDAQVWQAKIDALPVSQLEEASLDRALFRSHEIEAFARGIALLDNPDYPLVHRAFRLMNETMKHVAGNHYDRWRLFQIVFIVIQLPILAGRHYPELRQPGDDKVDILWFAAGGGKTEAFLGLLIWQLFFDRLRGKTLGVTALVRFPLRLLTFQQLQRIARVLAQAELIRKREGLGGARFYLGYFVGDNTRPNTIDNDRHTRYKTNGPDENLRSLIQCPFCSGKIVLQYNEQLRIIEHFCAQRQSCPGGQGRLPIYIVDADIYRFLPSVIVSTVDKLALIGQNPRFGNLFGRFTMVCMRHGVSFLDTNGKECEAAKRHGQHVHASSALLQTCAGSTVSYGPFVDPAPSLLIQDELHLLSEEMGTFDSHYETAALEIMRSLGFRPWKIIAATATIERFQDHAFHLYLKGARQFPCPGPGAYDSFYYQLNPEKIGRIFVGVLGIGRKHTPAVTRLLSLISRCPEKAGP